MPLIDGPIPPNNDTGEYGKMLSQFHRADNLQTAKDAVLNWGGGQNNNTILPGGTGDPATMPEGASEATGVDGHVKFADEEHYGMGDGLVASMKSAASAGAEAGRRLASGEIVPHTGDATKEEIEKRWENTPNVIKNVIQPPSPKSMSAAEIAAMRERSKK